MPRLLIVEDSPTQAEELRIVLEGEGFEVDAAPDGEKGLRKVKAAHYDAVVSDIVMPGLTGYELCQAIKSDPSRRDVPVLLLTTLSDPMDIIRGLECGADNFVVKPYRPANLVGRIRTLLANRALRTDGKLRLGIGISFLGRHFTINSDREQILDLLISTFEDTVRANLELRSKEADLAKANARIEAYARQLEERVRTSEEHFRGLVESMDDSVHVMGTDLRMTGLFGGGFGGQGSAPAAYLGKTFGQVFGAEAGAVHDAAGARALGGERVKFEWVLDAPGGLRHFHTALSPLLGTAGEVRGLVGVTRDVEEQRKLQAQLMVSDRMASIGMLAAGVAHEINNPLAAVTANLELAAEAVASRPAGDPELAEVQEELADALDGADRVRRIVQDLKILARTETSDGLGPSDVEGVMESSIRLAWNQIRHRARIARDYGKVPAALANESRLGQVFLNLLINAAQALPDGHADQNEIRVATRLDPDGRVVVEVHDTGPGIPAEIRRHIFSPFFTTKPVGVGTGLGLAICHRLVSSFGGEIRFDCPPGKGTTFSIVLPRAEVRPAAAGKAPGERVHAPRRGRVLVVDDEATIGSVVRRLLAGEHDVVSVTRGSDALDLVGRGERFDVILCDLMMPEMGGREMYEKLAGSAPEMAERVVFLTGGAFTPDAQEFLGRANRPRVEKPFDARQLRDAVNERVR